MTVPARIASLIVTPLAALRPIPMAGGTGRNADPGGSLMVVNHRGRAAADEHQDEDAQQYPEEPGAVVLLRRRPEGALREHDERCAVFQLHGLAGRHVDDEVGRTDTGGEEVWGVHVHVVPAGYDRDGVVAPGCGHRLLAVDADLRLDEEE